MIAIVRIGAAITLPGVDATVLQMWIKEMTENADRGAAAYSRRRIARAQGAGSSA